MDGVFIKPKAKRIQGVKPTNFFCNLENNNYISKFMNKSENSSGNIVDTQRGNFTWNNSTLPTITYWT